MFVMQLVNTDFLLHVNQINKKKTKNTTATTEKQKQNIVIK